MKKIASLLWEIRSSRRASGIILSPAETKTCWYRALWNGFSFCPMIRSCIRDTASRQPSEQRKGIMECENMMQKRIINPEHIKSLIEMLNNAPYYQLLGLRVTKLESGYAEVIMNAEKKHWNPLG